MWRSLRHYWRINLAVALGAAVATAVLTGALVVGDSVSGSLRDLTLERLGAIDSAIVLDRFFGEDLGDRMLAAEGTPVRAAAPAVFLSGSANHSSGRRASSVLIHGVDARFAQMFEGAEIPFDRAEGQLYPSVWLNASLARELAAAVGDDVVLAFGQHSDIPRETLIGEKEPEKVVDRVRLSVRGIVPDAGWGRFGITASQQDPLNAFVELDRLQRELAQSGRVNALYLALDAPDSDPREALAAAARVDDLGLQLIASRRHVDIHSDEFVFRPALDRELQRILRGMDLEILPVQGYLANAMRVGDRETPYSMVAALDPVSGTEWGSFRVVAGREMRPAGGDEIVLGRWAADDLAATPGDTLELDYYRVEDGERLETETRTFTVVGVVDMRGLGADSDLTPEYPGIEDADDIAQWDPPFPVDLDRVRDRDEQYWDDYGPAPKAFIPAATGRELWATRFGSTTSIRVGADSPGELIGRLDAALPRELDPGTLGLVPRPVKQQGLSSADGPTDFGQLFLAMSMFLIVSSAMLVSLLFGLAVEQRAKEIGLRRAIGFPAGKVRAALWREGSVLAALGGVLGAGLGVGYAGLLMVALRTLWRGAVGSSALFLHVRPMTLAIGWVAALVIVTLTIFLALRRLGKISPPALLAGRIQRTGRRGSGVPSRNVAIVSAVLGVGMVAAAFASPGSLAVGLVFGSATFLLVAGLAAFSAWCRRAGAGRSTRLPSPLLGVAVRNSAWSPGRSILSVALVACASFMIVAVGSSREELGDELEERESRAGGFGLVAEASVPLVQRLDRAEDRAEAGIAEEAFVGVEAVSFRLLPGDDASCLNLYQPEKPRVLGVPDAMIERAGFVFAQHEPLVDGETTPWDLLRRDLGASDVVPAILDANSAQWILKVKLGDDVTIEDEQGRPLRLRIVALLNKSVFQSELLVAENRFLEAFPSRTGYRYFLFDGPAESRGDLALELETALEPFGLDATTTRERIEAFLVVEHTYISTFQTLGGLGLLLGTIGLAIVMVRNVIERRRELATLRAFGYRRQRLGRMILVENAFLLFLGILLGTGTALVSVAPRLSSIGVPWASLAGTLALVAAVGMLSAILAVRSAIRTPLIPALKSE